MQLSGSTLLRFAFAGLIFAIVAGLGLPDRSQAQKSEPNLEYLATFNAPLLPPQVVANDLLIYSIPTDRVGWFKGPKINATPIQPCADWLKVQPNGNFWLDVRCTLKTDDDALVYIEYSGVIDWNEQINEKCTAGEVINGPELYFRTHPKFRTVSEKYA